MGLCNLIPSEMLTHMRALIQFFEIEILSIFLFSPLFSFNLNIVNFPVAIFLFFFTIQTLPTRTAALWVNIHRRTKNKEKKRDPVTRLTDVTYLCHFGIKSFSSGFDEFIPEEINYWPTPRTRDAQSIVHTSRRSRSIRRKVKRRGSLQPLSSPGHSACIANQRPRTRNRGLNCLIDGKIDSDRAKSTLNQITFRVRKSLASANHSRTRFASNTRQVNAMKPALIREASREKPIAVSAKKFTDQPRQVSFADVHPS